MSSESAFVAICLIAVMFAALGYGVVAIFWTVISAITPRVGKPNKQRMYVSFVWAAISCLVMLALVLLFVPSHGAVVILLLIFPVAALAAIGGACYDASNDD